MPNRPRDIVCVDLDGTLLSTDSLIEGVLALMRCRPWLLVLLPIWLLQGRAFMKAELAKYAEPDFATLPVRHDLRDWLLLRRSQGAELWLCTGATRRWAETAAQFYGFFDGVIASDTMVNLTGTRKAHRLVAQFGEKGFDYCGNEVKDLEVWRRARGAIVVGSGELKRLAAEAAVLVHHFPTQNTAFSVWLRALRVHQWAKNLLVFVPMLLAHRASDVSAWLGVSGAFTAFCFVASATYLLNDMADLPSDRVHPRKQHRPMASGLLSLQAGLAAIIVLFGLAAVLTLAMPRYFVLVVLGYLVITLAYSFFIKRFPLVDTLTLASLYTVRLVAGAVAVAVALSFWLLVFSGFLFFSLALVKRSAELRLWQSLDTSVIAGRGYQASDLPLVDTMGIASGLLSVLVLALYLNSPEVRVLYHHPAVLWGLCPLMAWWICRVWMFVHRGTMHDDPVVFALRDRASAASGVVAALLVWLAA